jgi:hypothetical protein
MSHRRSDIKKSYKLLVWLLIYLYFNLWIFNLVSKYKNYYLCFDLTFKIKVYYVIWCKIISRLSNGLIEYKKNPSYAGYGRTAGIGHGSGGRKTTGQCASVCSFFASTRDLMVRRWIRSWERASELGSRELNSALPEWESVALLPSAAPIILVLCY